MSVNENTENCVFINRRLRIIKVGRKFRPRMQTNMRCSKNKPFHHKKSAGKTTESTVVLSGPCWCCVYLCVWFLWQLCKHRCGSGKHNSLIFTARLLEDQIKSEQGVNFSLFVHVFRLFLTFNHQCSCDLCLM